MNPLTTHLRVISSYFIIYVQFLAGFPAFWQWWIIQVPAMLISVLLGEFMCMRAETQDISLGSKGGSNSGLVPSLRMRSGPQSAGDETTPKPDADLI